MKCSWSGGQYTLEIKDGIARLYNFVRDAEPQTPECFILEKPLANTFFLPAKRIDYQVSKWGVPSGTYEVKGQNISYFFIEVDGLERHISKDNCIVLEG